MRFFRLAVVLIVVAAFAAPASAFTPNPTLAAIPDNTVLDLGRYLCVQDPLDDSCYRIFSYTRFTYDPIHHQLLLFGGGHAAVTRNDVDVFRFDPSDPNALTWKSAYPPTPCPQRTIANRDSSTGTWFSDGIPISRHSLDLLVYAPDVAPEGVLVLVAPVEGRGGCEPLNNGVDDYFFPGKILHYDPVAKDWSSTSAVPDWGVSAAEYDPVSGRIIVVGQDGLWTYDPVTQIKTKPLGRFAADLGYNNNLVYYPPNQKMYYIARSMPGFPTTRIFEVTLNRSNWALSTVVELTGMVGAPNTQESGWAYDSVNQIIGGGVTNGVFYVFNPMTRVWIANVMNVVSSAGASPGTVSAHALEYNPVDNVFVYVSANTMTQANRTWAYRYSSGLPPPPPDTTPPTRSGGLPTGTLGAGTVATTVSLGTDENATCRYATTPGTAYGSMGSTFTTTGGTSHSMVATGLSDGGSYAFYVRCQDAAGNANPDDYTISFAVAVPDTTPPTVTETGPADGSTVSGIITLTATAADDVGVTSVQFRIDGVNLGAPVTVGPPYTLSWDTRGVSNGTHTVTAVARDAAGNTTTSTGVTVTVANAPAPPVAAYPFDENAGTSTADASGNGATGTLLNGATWAAGENGYGVSLDGTSGRVSAGVRPALQNLPGITAEAWVYPRTNGRWGWGTILVKARSISPPEIYGWLVGFDGSGLSRLRFTVEYSGTDLHVATAAGALVMNQWQHVAVTWDGTPSASNAHIYVNGAEVAYAIRQNPTGARVNDQLYPLTIGNSQFLDATWNGVIDDVRIYNRPLSPAEINLDMATPVGLLSGPPPVGDTTPPVRSGGAPTGTLAVGTTSATVSLTTNENATCRYATTPGVTYAAMTNTFAGAGGTSHSTVAAGLVDGGSYQFYVRCRDGAGNADTSDYLISFAVAAPDTTPPARSGGAPTGTLAAGTIATTLSVTTNESATCRYETTPDVAYAAMSITFATTGGTSHSSAVNGLVNGGSYSFYVRCQDAAGNADPDDYVIGFSVAMPDTVPPTVTVTAPMDGSTVSGVITLTATAADDVAVASVQFRVDGVAVGAPVTVGPTYTRTWDTRGVLNGARVVTALALDTAGNPTMSAGVTVTVSNVPEPPVDAYAFDEGFGSTTADATGNGGTGTLLNGAAWSTGHTANAVNFDGVSARVSAGVRSRLANLAAVTAEAWIYPRSNGRWGWGTMLVKARSISPPEIYGWILGFDGTGVGRLRFTVEYSGTDLHVATAANALLMNQWQHVAVTWDGTPGAAGVHIYVNGVEVGYAVQQNPTGTRINDAAYPLTIGNSQFLDATWNGVIDDVRIYNRALTPAEILSDMTRPVGPGG